MQFTFKHTTSREELQALSPVKRDKIQELVEHHHLSVLGAARMGKASYFWWMSDTEFAATHFHGYTGPKITLEDMMEGFRARYPGCTVTRDEEREFIEDEGRWISLPGIRVDWS